MYAAGSQQCRHPSHERLLLSLTRCAIRTGSPDWVELSRGDDACRFLHAVGSNDLVCRLITTSVISHAGLSSSYVRFVLELQKATDRPDNMPPVQLDTSDTSNEKVDETIAKSIIEARKDR